MKSDTVFRLGAPAATLMAAFCLWAGMAIAATERVVTDGANDSVPVSPGTLRDMAATGDTITFAPGVPTVTISDHTPVDSRR